MVPPVDLDILRSLNQAAGPWVDWARPPEGHVARPSWLGRDDVTPIPTLHEMTFGERNPKR